MISCDVMSQPLRAWYSFRAGNGVPRYPLSRQKNQNIPIPSSRPAETCTGCMHTEARSSVFGKLPTSQGSFGIASVRAGMREYRARVERIAA